MLLERSEIIVAEGTEDAFSAIMHERGLPTLAAFKGVKSAQIGRGVENPTKFIIFVEWDSLEAHAAFAQSAIYKDFVGLFGPFSKGGAMEHFIMSPALSA